MIKFTRCMRTPPTKWDLLRDVDQIIGRLQGARRLDDVSELKKDVMPLLQRLRGAITALVTNVTPPSPPLKLPKMPRCHRDSVLLYNWALSQLSGPSKYLEVHQFLQKNWKRVPSDLSRCKLAPAAHFPRYVRAGLRKIGTNYRASQPQ